MVGSQIANLIPSLSFGHELCFKCPNGSCEPILDIYVSITFQWCKGLFKARGFDLYNHCLKIRESTGIPTPNMGVHLGVWMFIFTLPHTPGSFSWSNLLQTLTLVASPRLGLRQFLYDPIMYCFIQTITSSFYHVLLHSIEHMIICILLIQSFTLSLELPIL